MLKIYRSVRTTQLKILPKIWHIATALRLSHVEQSMANYLIRRTGRYSYRRRYPTEVAALLGRSEFVQALGTADPKEAARLARIVAVAFDKACDDAVQEATQKISEAASTVRQETGEPTDRDVAKSVLDSLPGIIRTVTESVIAEQARNAKGWKDEVAWRRRAALAHIAGQMPAGIQMHPFAARAMLNALDAAESGSPLIVDNPVPMQEPTKVATPVFTEQENKLVTAEAINLALKSYAGEKSGRRTQVARRCAERTLNLPCTQQEAIKSITQWCTTELAREKKPASVWTEASAVISLLKFVPGWHSFSVPKVGDLRSLRGAGRSRKDSKAPMPVALLHTVLLRLPEHLPRNGNYWHATLLLCALYGFRPGELLQSGEESLQNRTDLFGNEQMVFKVGLNGAKNESSKRDLPVPDELVPLFKLALSQGACIPETTRTRVERLNKLVKKACGNEGLGLTLYSIRHTFADVARACKYSDAQFGPIMGHKSSSGITASYGGSESLDHIEELLTAVKVKLFPEGLSPYSPLS
jgi:integrase